MQVNASPILMVHEHAVLRKRTRNSSKGAPKLKTKEDTHGNLATPPEPHETNHEEQDVDL